MSTRKKLLLVYPKSNSAHNARMRSFPSLMNRAGFLNVSLATVAGMTPPDLEVQIVDEDRETIDFDQHYDIVGITGFYTQIGRAKYVADQFRERGVLVVCGGPGISLSPHRWRPFCDVTFIGEAERTWPQFVKDYLAGDYKDEYEEKELLDMSDCRLPDYSGCSPQLLNSYLTGYVQMSRGCPYKCEFCSAIKYSGNLMRYKQIDLIIQEIEQLQRFGILMVVFAGDNFSAGRKKAKSILRALREWNRQQRTPMAFFSEVSIETAEDDEFLELAAEAGLTRVSIGIESPNNDSLQEVNKLHNTRVNMIQCIKRFHQHGIAVLGTTITGFDHDDLSVFQQHFDFFMEAGLMDPLTFPMQALDGTDLKKRIIEEGRYIDVPVVDDGSCSTMFDNFTVRPKQMTVDELRQGVLWLKWACYQPEAMAQRVKKFFEHFESSEVRSKLSIPKPSHRIRDAVPIFARILMWIMTKCPKRERRAFFQMLNYARKSSHPQAYQVAVSRFMMMMASQAHCLEIEPDIANIPYPTREDGQQARVDELPVLV